MAILQEIRVPLLAVNDTALTVVALGGSNGQQVKIGDLLMVFETSKTTYEVTAEAAGYVNYFCELNNDYLVNHLVATIVETMAEVTLNRPEATMEVKVPSAPISEKNTHWSGKTFFSDKAAKLIAIYGYEYSLFEGRDFVGSIEVEAMHNTQIAPTKSNASALPVRTPISDDISIDSEKVLVQKLSSSKKREIAYLSSVQAAGLTSTINTVVEMDGFFSQVNASMKFLKNSLLPFVIYECSRLLVKYPLLNAYYAGTAIALYKEVNIGFAIDIDKGLKVVKLPATNKLNLQEIEKGILKLSDKYIDDKLEIADLSDISFTITDLSGEQVAFFRPLVNMSNSAILGISSIDEQLQRCILTITFDHRVTEGKLAAQFLQELKNRIESYRADERNRNATITCFKCFTSLKDDIGSVGFASCITPEGKKGYICQRCFKGY